MAIVKGANIEDWSHHIIQVYLVLWDGLAKHKSRHEKKEHDRVWHEFFSGGWGDRSRRNISGIFGLLFFASF